ncbi:hypothetical protein ACFY84_35760 [Streptomyces sp. NPDC012438]|uniref:hypothetical protein n=1 Tax=Streptomyces sp. NPDC012438 TaxID=3364833 RepID=UPI0036E736BC
MAKLKWARPVEWAEVRFGTSRAGAALVLLCRTAGVDTLTTAHLEIDWEELRRVEKGRRSPLAALSSKTKAASGSAQDDR